MLLGWDNYLQYSVPYSSTTLKFSYLVMAQEANFDRWHWAFVHKYPLVKRCARLDFTIPDKVPSPDALYEMYSI